MKNAAYPACTYDTLWRQHYVRTSQKCLINCHILLQYFEYFSIYNWYKFCVNWSSFEWIMKKNKKGSFLWNTVLPRPQTEMRPERPKIKAAGRNRDQRPSWDPKGRKSRPQAKIDAKGQAEVGKAKNGVRRLIIWQRSSGHGASRTGRLSKNKNNVHATRSWVNCKKLYGKHDFA